MNNYRVAVVAICLNQPYWQYIGRMIESAKKFFLKGHQVDFFVWSDMPQDSPIGARIIPTEPFEWPIPTLHRYHLFLREEEMLKAYDFIYYIDADMVFVSRVGDEVLTKDLMGAQHPMYAVSPLYVPPYEPNKKSCSYIPRPGRIFEKDGKKRLEPLYFAGGFQGGRSDKFIEAMQVMKGMIDRDFMKSGYIPVWNDETVWNRYLFDHPPSTVLSPSYVYPDSMNKEYYQKVWGRNYVPKLITITKPFTLTSEGGENVRMQNL